MPEKGKQTPAGTEKPQPKQSLQRQLVASSLLAAALGFLALITVAVVQDRHTTIAHTSEDQLQLARNTLNAVDRTLYHQYTQAQLLATDKVLADGLAAKKPTIAITATQAARLKELAAASGNWQTLRLVRPDGTIMASTDGTEAGGRLPETDSYRAVLETAQGGQPAYSEAAIQSGQKQPTMVFAAPVMSAGGPAGALVGELDWAAVAEIIRSDGGRALRLYDRDGHRLDANNDNLDNQELIVSRAYQQGYKDFHTQGWVLAMGTPAATALAGANQLAWTLPVVALLLMMAALPILRRYFKNKLILPLQATAQVTHRIGTGGLLNIRVEIKSDDEIGLVGQSINEMVDKLQDIYHGLEKAATEWTDELAKKVEELQNEKAKDEAILGSIGEAMIATDGAMRVLVANKVAAELLEFDAEASRNKWLSELVPLRTLNGQPVPLEKLPSFTALKTAEPHTDEYSFRRHDNKEVILSVTANPILQNGRTSGAIMILRDVTREHEIDRMKTEFISLASHQLRTPLSAVKWFSEMLLVGDAGKLNQEQREFTQNISESTQRMIELVNSLLNISRIESGRIIVEPEPTDMHEMLESVVQDLESRVTERHHKLTVDIDPKLKKINLDPQLIRQVYINLLTNSIKYTPEGGKLTVSVKKDGNQLLSMVQDNGHGIPPEAQARMFEKFFRADNAVKIETDGTGLGMYMVKSIVESSGGKIWFDSELNKGTTFWFTVPLRGMEKREGDVVLDDEIVF